MILSHKIQLDPTVKQAQYFERACGTARFTWNWALAKCNEYYESGEKYKISDIKKHFNSIKYEQFPWLKDIHRDAHSQPFVNLQKAFNSFFKKTTAKPMFKKKGKTKDSFYVANDKFHVNGFLVRLPIVGNVRMTEKLRFQDKIMYATVSREVNRWFISIAVNQPESFKTISNENLIGVDVGITTFATLSTGEKIKSPMPLKAAQKRLKRASRQHSRKQLGSKNRSKSSMKLAKIHCRVRNIRNDFLHKLSTKLAKNHSQIGIENLNVEGMLKNHCLAQAISDSSWSEFRRQLSYKTKLYGSELVVFDRFYPSSKICSNCGVKIERLPLSVREWVCPTCGATHDRDINAAINLKPTTDGLSGSYACGDYKCDHGSRNYTGAHISAFTR